MAEIDDREELFRIGLQNRREVVGTEHVDRSMANADEFSMAVQRMVTEYCWGAIWSRPGLERKTRSFLNLAMLGVMNRQHEFKVHIRGALTNGATREEILEVILQIMIYAGVPVALECTRLAQEAFKEVDAQG